MKTVMICQLASVIVFFFIAGCAKEAQFAVPNLKALAEFKKSYALLTGEDLKYVAPPFLPSRLVYYRYDSPGQAEAIPRGPDNMYFLWSEGEGLKTLGMAFGKSDLRMVLSVLAGIYHYEVEGDQELLKTKSEGDFIIREDLPLDKRVVRLEDIFQRDLQLPVRMTFREVSRDVIVVSGNYRYHTPLPGQPDSIKIYGKTFEDGGGGSSGDFQSFLESGVGEYIGRWVVNEVETPPEGTLRWSWSYQKGPKEEELALQHLTEQTGLTFKDQARRVRVLFVERTN